MHAIMETIVAYDYSQAASSRASSRASAVAIGAPHLGLGVVLAVLHPAVTTNKA